MDRKTQARHGLSWEIGTVIAGVVAILFAVGSQSEPWTWLRVSCLIVSLALGVILAIWGRIPNFEPGQWVRILVAIIWLGLSVSFILLALEGRRGPQFMSTMDQGHLDKWAVSV